MPVIPKRVILLFEQRYITAHVNAETVLVLTDNCQHIVAPNKKSAVPETDP